MESKVRLDGVLIDMPQQVVNLEGILSHILNNNISAGREIVEVRLDGSIFNEAFPHEASLLTDEDFHTVDILTEKTDELAELSLKQLPYFITLIKKGFRSACDYLRDSALESEGNRLMADSAECLGALINHFWILIQNTKNGKGDDLRSAYSDLTASLAELLDEIIIVQREYDPILLADLLEFEILPILDRLEEKIEQILN